MESDIASQVEPALSEISKEQADKLVEPEEAKPKIEEEEPAGLPVEPKDMEAKAKETEPPKKLKPKKKPKAKREKPAKIIKLPEPKPAAPSHAEASSEVGEVAPVKEEPAPITEIRLAEEQEKPAAAAKGKLKKKTRRPSEALEEDKRFLKKKIAFRKKEVLDKSDLYDGRAAKGRKGRRLRKGKVAIKGGETTLITTPKAIKRRIKMDEAIVVSDLAKRMGIKGGEVIKRLMALGVMATLNATITFFKPPPNREAMTRAINTMGNAIIASINLIIIR